MSGVAGAVSAGAGSPAAADHRGKLQIPDQISVSIGEGKWKTFAVVREQIPPELHADLARDFNQQELDQVYTKVHKSLAPTMDRPGALFVIGPSAVGKSVLSFTMVNEIFGSETNAVVVDGGGGMGPSHRHRTGGLP